MDVLSALIARHPVATALLLLLPGQLLYLGLTALLPRRATLEVWDVYSLLLGTALSLLYLHRSARTVPQMALVLCVVLWASRLALFLGLRARRGFEDSRLAKFRASRLGHVQWALAQTLWMLVALLPAWVSLNAASSDGPPLSSSSSFSVTDVLGLAVFLAGFAIESTADRQKAAFLARARDGGKAVCDVGLFRYARFPQYFGEITIWIGLSVLAWSGARGTHRALLPLSPLFVYKLLSAVCIPIAERSVRKRAGEQELQRYLRTNVLLPWPRAN